MAGLQQAEKTDFHKKPSNIEISYFSVNKTVVLGLHPSFGNCSSLSIKSLAGKHFKINKRSYQL
jgi:hypothetical protein